MTFPRYPKYKDSGVEWLGEVPEHWELTSLGRVSLDWCDGPFGSGLKSEHYVDAGVRVVRLQNIRQHGFDDSDQAYIDEAYYHGELNGGHDVRDGDLLIAGLGDDRNTVGRACVAPGGIAPAMVKADCFRFRLDLKRGSPHFVASQLTASSIADAGFFSSGSTRSRIPLSVMAGRRLALPPLAEQSQISAFLDRETRKIDELIAEQRRLMDLLKEKRQAVISHAVTRGLNPDAPMKPSGIVWLGDVPAHWEARKLLDLARLESGHTPSRQHPEWWIEEECVIPWFTLADVSFLRDPRNWLIETTSQKISEIGLENSAARRLPVGSVLLSRTASVGFSGVTGVVLAVSQDFAAWVCGPKIRPTYLLFCLRAMTQEFDRLKMGSTHQTIYMPDIEAFRVPVPPVAEQAMVEEHIMRETEKLDALTAEAQRAIDLLQERRTALISAAVTGQIDVRNLV